MGGATERGQDFTAVGTGIRAAESWGLCPALPSLTTQPALELPAELLDKVEGLDEANLSDYQLLIVLQAYQREQGLNTGES